MDLKKRRSICKYTDTNTHIRGQIL